MTRFNILTACFRQEKNQCKQMSNKSPEISLKYWYLLLQLTQRKWRRKKSHHKACRISLEQWFLFTSLSTAEITCPKINNNYQTSTFSFVSKIVFISICDWYENILWQIAGTVHGPREQKTFVLILCVL